MSFSSDYFKKCRRVLGRNVKDIRQLKGISLEQLHEKSGLSMMRILQIEEGRNRSDLQALCRLAYGLGVSPERLLRE